jgi:hypothetical protein
MGNTWEIHGKYMGTPFIFCRFDTWERHGKTMGKRWGSQKMGKQWETNEENMGNQWDINGFFFQDSEFFFEIFLKYFPLLSHCFHISFPLLKRTMGKTHCFPIENACSREQVGFPHCFPIVFPLPEI